MQRRDLLIGLVVVTVWGLNFIAIKLGLRDMPPLLLGALRFVLACFPIIFFLPLPPIPWRSLVALGLSLNVGQFSLLFIGMKVGMPAGLASLVLQSQAFFTLLIAVAWLGERWRWNHLAGLVIAACGMTIIGVQQGGEMTIVGFGLTLAAAASWSAGNIVMRQITVSAPPFSMLSLVVWAGAVAILPLLLLSWLLEGYDAWLAAYQTLNWISVSSLVYIAFFATLAGFGLWGKLLSRYPAAVVSPLSLLVPIVGLSSSIVLLGESISLLQGLGAILVMSGLAVNVLGGKQEVVCSQK
ncbi:acetylserine transporter [Anaerosporomusa subterranea]|uniref:Acetylserine transporter n=1 Tax=Anaerosporomusa subterranea TaxID=1794912 RepID=A0A154BVP8_ANASB|nr:EamA family transporter [Anaerosporomusa subterranea]KYZ78009.1 acetylserine transporter [Anaerosporomusa subterranea]